MAIIKLTPASQLALPNSMDNLQPIYAQSVHPLALFVLMPLTVLLANLQPLLPLIICATPIVILPSATPTMAPAGIIVLMEPISPILTSYAQHVQLYVLLVVDHRIPALPVQPAIISTLPALHYVLAAILATQLLYNVSVVLQ
jgi:hypothetical protein